MGNSDGIWQWCRDGKKTILRKSKTRSMVDEHSSLAKDGSTPNIIPKGKQCVDYSPISKSSTTHEGDALKSRTYWTNSSISVIKNQVSLSETNSDAMTDNTHYISGPNGWLPSTLGFRGESSVEDTDFYHRKQPSKSRIHRMVQQAAFKQNRLLSDQGIDSSCQTRYAARQKETSANASSSCSISKVVVEDLDLQSLTVNKQMSVVDGYEASSHYNNCPCHPPACNKHMRDHGLVSEDQITKSEILFPELHILADTAIRSESLMHSKRIFSVMSIANVLEM